MWEQQRYTFHHMKNPIETSIDHDLIYRIDIRIRNLAICSFTYRLFRKIIQR